MITVLLVDDDPDSRNMLGHLLNASNNKNIPLRLVYAESLSQARLLLKTDRPHLTFMDLNLVDDSIDQVLAFIKEESQPPVIVVSGLPPDHIRPGKAIPILAECLLAGAEDYLEKLSQRFYQAQVEAFRVILRNHKDAQSD